MTLDDHDFVIVGAGSAGCVLADRLTRDRHTVLLLEAGPSDSHPYIKLPIGYGRLFYHPEFNWRYRSEPDPNLGNRAAYWPRGRGVGGSSSINALFYCRGLPSDFDDLRSVQLGGARLLQRDLEGMLELQDLMWWHIRIRIPEDFLELAHRGSRESCARGNHFRDGTVHQLLRMHFLH